MTRDGPVELCVPDPESSSELPSVVLSKTETAALFWNTPGLSISSLLDTVENVVAVFERIDGDEFAVFVLLSDDPEETLDRVFEAEESLRRRLPRTSFDIRVSKVDASLDFDAFGRGSITRFRRPPAKA